jgi:hypothetical protein
MLDLGFGIFLGIAVFAAAACEPPVQNKPVASTPAPGASVSPATAPSTSPSTAPAAAGASKADALAGKWTGAEGTYLNVTKKGDKYSIEISNLDGPQTFEGTAKGDVIEFTRKGKTETVKAATGAETGMKGFEKETNCVVVTKGSEGYCKK